MAKQLRSFLLPVTVAGIIPFFLVAKFDPFRISYLAMAPALQMTFGPILVVVGLVLLVTTVRLFSRIGKGTLAPWDPTKRLVVQGPYRYTRNPMISGVAFVVLGEGIILASWLIAVLFVLVILVNTLYFKLFEERGLVRRFGEEYMLYRRNVPMWIPRLRPWSPNQGRY